MHIVEVDTPDGANSLHALSAFNAFTARRGAIDTLAPRLTVSARQIGTGASAQTEYSFTASGLFL